VAPIERATSQGPVVFEKYRTIPASLASLSITSAVSLDARRDLSARRPVSDQIPGYIKNMNVQLARLTTLADLAGTDLREFLERAVRLAAD
jgi:hypothetical protein